jgi:flagellar hook-basal body complex protein FliE
MQLHSNDLFSRHQERVRQMMDQLADRNRSTSQNEAKSPFADLLTSGIGRVNAMQHESQEMIEQLLSGEDVNQAEVFTSVQKADMSFRMLVQIRNKLMQAYEEINSIRV